MRKSLALVFALLVLGLLCLLVVRQQKEATVTQSSRVAQEAKAEPVIPVVKTADKPEPARNEPKPNLDRRLELDRSGIVISSRDAALVEFKKQLPGVTVDFDPVTQSPKWIGANTRLLTSPQAGKLAKDADAPVKDFIEQHRGLFGHGADVLNQSRRVTDYSTARSTSRKVVWHQQLDGIDLFEAVIQANLTAGAALINIGSQMMPSPQQAMDGAKRAALLADPPVAVEQAVAAAGQNVGENIQAQGVKAMAAAADVPDKRQQFRAAMLTDAEAKLLWVPMSATSLRLAWDVTLTSRSRAEMYRVLVDAEDGSVLVRQSLTAYISPAAYRVYTTESPTPLSPGHETPSSLQPATVLRTLVTTSAMNVTASPNGWINDGINITSGNNVDAYADTNNDNVADLPRTTGAPFRNFDFPFDLTQSPSLFKDASITQLFYWTNFAHDRLYELGFTEAAGNFQISNFGRGGSQGDPVNAETQDGGGTNNANFSTPVDGGRGRMQMYNWTHASPARDSSFEVEIVLHEFGHGVSNRLVGGPSVTMSSLSSRGMGEGWSDFYGLSLTAEQSDNPHGNWAKAAWVNHNRGGWFSENYYYGLRRYSYSTDMLKNPLTFRDIDPTQIDLHPSVSKNPTFGETQDATQVHHQGTVWCTMLWEMRANLILKHGFSVGNERALFLVTEGMKLGPANPNFVQSRDGILQAALVNHPADLGEVWAAFAKRGLGHGATAPVSTTTTGVVESYSVPDSLEISDRSGWNIRGDKGGSFTPVTQTLSLRNDGTTNLAWTASAGVDWLSISPANGQLSPGASVTVEIQTHASNMPGGFHAANVTFTNVNSSFSQPVGVRLYVAPQVVEVFALNNQPGWTMTGQWAYGTPTGGGGGAGNSDPSSGATGGQVFGVNLNGNVSTAVGGPFYLTSTPQDLRFHHKTRLRFKRWLNTPGLFETKTAVEVSTDGQNWKSIFVNPYTSVNDDNWQNLEYDISAIADRQQDVQVRWSYQNRIVTSAQSGWNIDDIEILGEPTVRFIFDVAESAPENAGTLTATLRLSQALPTDVTANLNSSDLSAAIVPETVTFLAGEEAKTFTITLVDDAGLDGTQISRILATASSVNSATHDLSVTDNETATLTLNAPAFVREGTLGVTVSLQVSAAPTTDVRVKLIANVPAISMPSSITLPAGQTSPVSFTIDAPDNSYAEGSKNVTLRAVVENWMGAEATVNVEDDEVPSIQLSGPNSITEGNGTTAYTVSVNTIQTTDKTISLSAGGSAEVTMPSTVTIPAGALSASFLVRAVDDVLKDGTIPVTLTAEAADYTSGLIVVQIRDNELHHFNFNPIPNIQVAGQPIGVLIQAKTVDDQTIPSFTGTVTLTAKSSGNPLTMTPGISGAFSAGQWSGSVTISTVQTNVKIQAASGVAFAESNSFNVTMGPRLAVNPKTVEFNVPEEEASSAQILTLANAGTLPAEWSARFFNDTFEARPDLDLVLANLNENFDDITSLIPTMYAFTDGVTGTNIPDGGNDMFDNGNYLGAALTVFTDPISYSDNAILNNSSLGIGGRYFTRKHPGLFVFAADVNGLNYFEITGGLGADGSGTANSTVLTVTRGGVVYKGFVKRVYGTSDPSVNHLIIVADNGSASHDFSTDTNSDYHRLSNLSDVNRLYYLLYASSGGAFISNAQTQLIMEAFLDSVLKGKAWMTMSPATGSVPAAGSTQMAIAATTDGLSAGSYQGTLQFSSNSTTALQPSVLATLNVLPGVQRFEWGPIPALQQVNTPFNGTLTAKDASGNTSTSYQGRAMINFATETVATTGAGLVTYNQLLVASNKTARTQAIYTPQEIGTAGLLSRLAFEITSAPGLLDQFTVRLKHSPKVNYVSNATWESSGWTTAFTGTLNAAAAGWHSLDFQNVFAYDGVSPLMVDISFQNISVVASGIIRATAVSPSRVINNSGSASPLTWSGSIPSAVLSANLPNLRFTKKYIQPGNPSEVIFVNGVWTGLLTSALSFGEVFVEAIHPVRPGVSGRSNALQITRLGALSLSIPASVSESTAPFTGSVMASVAPETNLTVQLFSSQPSVASLPATVVIPAGQTSVSFLSSVEDDDLLDGPVNVSFNAGAPAYDSALSQLTIQDDETATLSLTLPPTLTEGQSTTSGQAIVHLAQAALIDVTVSLQSSLPEYVTVPATVTILAGQTNAGFTLNAPQNSKIEDLHQIEITASSSDAVPATGSLDVLDDENRNLQLALNYSALREDGAAVNSAGYVSISGTLTAPLVVTLMSDDTTELTINQTITIPAGSTISPSFTLTPVNDTDFDGSQTVTLTASAEGFSQVGRTIIVRDDEVHHFGVSMTSNKQVKNRPFNVTFTAQDVNNVTVTNYSGTPTLTAMNGEVALPLTPTSLTAFSLGVKTQSMTISEFASQAVLSVSDSTLGISGTSQPFSVGSGAAVSFVWSTIASGLPSGVPFPVTITARDGEGNNATDFNGNADLSLASGVTIGSAGTTWSLPLYSYYHDARTQSIYTAAELGGARTFNSLSLHVNTLPGQSLNAFSIRLKHTTKNDFSTSAAWESSGWTVCHLSSQNISSTGWVKFPFSQTFSYNGTDHLMIDISFNNTFYTSYGSVYATQTSTPRSIYAYSDSGQGDPLSWSGSSPSASTSVLRPDIRLGELNQVQISPANTGSFSTGVWTGNIALSAVVTDQRLRAASGSAVGDSNVFSSGTPLLAMELPDFVSEGQGTFTGELGLTAQRGSSVSLNITSSDPALIQPSSSTVNLPAGQKTLPLSFNISNDAVKSGTRHVTLTLSAAGFSTINAVIEVRDDELETLTMEAIPSPQIKNGPIPVILTARNAEGHIITSFQGTPSLTAFHGPRSLALSIAQTSGFVQGVATIQALIDDYATAAVITARQGEVEASSNAFAIGAGAVARFRWSTPGPLQITGVGFPVSLSAEDAYGNIRSDYSGTARLEAVAQSVDIGTADSSTDLLFGGGRTQSRTQQIFHASELAQAGRIVSLTLNILPTSGSSAYQNFTIRMKHTNSTGYATTAQKLWEYVGFTTVFQSGLLINQSGPLKLQFTTPFDYDGRSNLMIDFSFNGMTGGTREVAATTRPAPYRTLSYQSSSSGDPLLWSGNLPTATSSDTTADLKVDFAPNQSISPTETEAFENGLWSGNIAVGQASPALVLLAKDDNTGGIGASDVLRVIPSQIPLAPEPAITGGTTNRLYWEEPDSTGIEYELQRDITPEFLNPVSTGYITATSHLQTGLTDGQLYYYRLRVRGSGGTSWVGDWSEPVPSLQDATPPTIRLNERSLITTTSAAVISGTATDNNGIKEIYIEQSTPVTPLPNSDHWSHTLTNLPYGTSDILVQARDQADPPNLASLVVKVHRVMNAEGTGVPVFQQGPRSQWGTLGQPVEWLAAVQGARPMRYEWTRGGKVLPGVNDAEWTIPAVKISDVEGYSVTAANQLGETAPSDTAWLGVVTPTATPRVSLKTYDTLKLQCSAVVPKGAETIYRWKKGSSNLSDGLLPSGATISGANTAQLTISQVTVAEAGSYTCQVTMRASGNPSITNGNTEVSIATALPVITSTPVPAELWVSQSVHGYLTASHNPTQFIVKNLPKGLRLDPATGLITGRLTTPSKIDSRTRLPIPYQISFSAKNAIGPGPVMVVSLIVKDHLGNLAGNYDGLVERDAGSNFRLGGSLKMTVAKTGVATGSFSLAGQRYTFVQPLEPELDEEGGLTGKAVLDFGLSRPKPKGLGPLSIRLWISEDASSITDGWIEDLQVQKLQNTKNYGLAIMPGVADDAQAGVSIARFRLPAGLAADSDGLVYVADSGNHTIRIMRPSYGLHLFVSTLAGTAGVRGSQDGTIPRFDTPRALTLGPDHALYIIDQGSRLIRRLDNGIATTLAGSAVWTETINGLGDQAGFKSPHAICADPSGNLYVTDDQSHVIRKITPAGQVTTLAGTANVKGYVNASGAKARFNGPRGIVYDAFHKALFVTDGDKFIRRVSLTGVVSTWSDRFNMPRALSPDGRGAFYVLTKDGIHRISADKIIHALRDHDDDQSLEASSLVFLPQTNTLLLSSAHEIQELSFNPQRLTESNIRLLRAVKPGYARTAGNYNAHWNTLTQDAAVGIPANHASGYLHIKVQSNGLVNSAGRTMDGASITHSCLMNDQGEWNLHQTLYSGAGSFQGSLKIIDDSLEETTDFSWRRNDPGLFTLPHSYETDVSLFNSRIEFPGDLHRQLGLTELPSSVLLQTEGRNPEANFEGMLSLNAPSKWKIPSSLSSKPTSLKFSVDPKTGVFNGSYTDATTRKKVSFGGIFTKLNSLASYSEGIGFALIPVRDENGVEKISLDAIHIKKPEAD